MRVIDAAARSLALASMPLALSGCITRNPSIEIDRRADGSYRIEVLRCGRGDDRSRSEVRDDLDHAAKRRCPHGHRWLNEPEYAPAHLGTAVLGECPATKAVAIALCENKE